MARMPIGLITGTGTYAPVAVQASEPETVDTRFGPVRVTTGRLAGTEVIHLSRHGEGHERLSNQVTHRANIVALKELGADAVLAATVCGAVDPEVELGSLVVFDDLHFVTNRLPDGSLCTLHDTPGARGRGHWIFERPYADEPRRALLEGARASGREARDGGCYGHVDGPRFNTAAEIRGLARCGVTAVSQTAGPETVLAGEAELPYALIGYATDYANGVMPAPTPAEELARLIGQSRPAFEAVLAGAVERLAGARPAAPGVHYRFDP